MITTVPKLRKGCLRVIFIISRKTISPRAHYFVQCITQNMNHFLKYKLVFGKPLPGNRFKPGGCIVNRNFAEEYRQGKCSLDQFDELRHGVLETRNRSTDSRRKLSSAMQFTAESRRKPSMG